MNRLLKERLKFFGEIVGALLIDAAFLSAWALIDHGVGLLINYFTSGQTPLYILLPKYVLDYSPPLVIAFFVLVDVVRALKKLFDLLLKGLRGEKGKGHGKDKAKGTVNAEEGAEAGRKE